MVTPSFLFAVMPCTFLPELGVKVNSSDLGLLILGDAWLLDDPEEHSPGWQFLFVKKTGDFVLPAEDPETSTVTTPPLPLRL